MTADELASRSSATAPRNCPRTISSHIDALGFRGEALPSIGAVSRMRIVSRPPAADIAWEIAVEAGKKRAPVPAAHPPGTRVEVRDLFFATPARLKFLKTPRTERDMAVDAVRRLAMAYPAIVVHGDRRRRARAAAACRGRRAGDMRPLARIAAGGTARARFRRELGRDRRRARRVSAERLIGSADPQPRRCRATNISSSTAGRCATNCWSARCAAPIRMCWRAIAIRSSRCFSTGHPTRSTSMSIRPRPRYGFAMSALGARADRRRIAQRARRCRPSRLDDGRRRRARGIPARRAAPVAACAHFPGADPPTSPSLALAETGNSFPAAGRGRSRPPAAAPAGGRSAARRRPGATARHLYSRRDRDRHRARRSACRA